MPSRRPFFSASGVCGDDCLWPQLGKDDIAKSRDDIYPDDRSIVLVAARRYSSFYVGQPALKESRDCDPRRVDSGAALRLGDQTRTLDLGLALGAGERMPAALALPDCGSRKSLRLPSGPGIARGYAPSFPFSLEIASDL